VERASAIAIDRNVAMLAAAEKAKQPKPAFDGLRQDDFTAALTAMHKEQYGANHFDELREFIDTQKIDASSASIEQCHDGAKITPQKTQPIPSGQVVAIPIPTKKGGGGYDA
jgi:hypothetical protein